MLRVLFLVGGNIRYCLNVALQSFEFALYPHKPDRRFRPARTASNATTMTPSASMNQCRRFLRNGGLRGPAQPTGATPGAAAPLEYGQEAIERGGGTGGTRHDGEVNLHYEVSYEVLLAAAPLPV